MKIFVENSAPCRPVLQAAFKSGLADAGYTAGDGTGGTIIVNFNDAAGQYDDGQGLPGKQQKLYVDIAGADADAQCTMIVAAGGLVSAHAAQTSIKQNHVKPFLVLIGQTPKFQLDNSNYCGGVNLDTPNQNAERHDFLVGHYDPVRKGRVCLIWNKNSHMGKQEKKAWIRNGWPEVSVANNTDGDIIQAFISAKQKAEAVVISADPYFTSRMDTVVAVANAEQLYVCYPSPVYRNAATPPNAGVSMIYGPDLEFAYRLLGRKSAAILDSVSAGIDPPDTGLDHGTTTAPIFLGG